MAASKPFRAEMLSAKRQLMGILGLSDPSKRTLAAASVMPLGRVEEMRGLLRIPFSKIFWVSCGIE